MENEQIKAKLKEIQDIVADLQEPIKTIAAQELIAKMLGTKQATEPTAKKRATKTNKEASNKAGAVQEDEAKDREMTADIDRTEHAIIHKLSKNIDKALYILKVIKDKGYTGLNPSQITSILIDVFGVKANLPAISMALINDKFYTTKTQIVYKGSKANQYKIMQAGIDYIDKVVNELNQEPKEVENE